MLSATVRKTNLGVALGTKDSDRAGKLFRVTIWSYGLLCPTKKTVLLGFSAVQFLHYFENLHYFTGRPVCLLRQSRTRNSFSCVTALTDRMSAAQKLGLDDEYEDQIV